MNDTSPEIQMEYDRRIRALTPQERFARGLSLTRTSREMCLAGIKMRHPQFSEQEIRIHLRDFLYTQSKTS